MQPTHANKNSLSELDIDLEPDLFLRRLLRELSGTLEEVVGLDEASGFISIVGQHIADWINESYRTAKKTNILDASSVADVLVDLKQRIKGDFHLIEHTKDRIVLGNRACPFGDQVKGRQSLCMMTSTVFGTIAAENLGYAKVELQETIARGHSGCRVVVHLKEAEDVEGVEYYRS